MKVARGVTLSATVALWLAALLPGVAQAAPPLQISEFCPTGSTAARCQIPRGIAINQTTGDVYVADNDNIRVDQLTVWGEFVRAWGWDVVASGPDNTGTGFEICNVAANPTDVCQRGSEGGGVGQFEGLQGIAVDGAGNVYAADRRTNRVQKFDSDGHFKLMFGGGVNQGPLHPGNLCTAQNIAEGDACGAGTIGNPGPGEGQFGDWPVASFITIGAGNAVYVGDQERIQVFNPNGTFKEQISLAGKGFVSGLAKAPGEEALYASFAFDTGNLSPASNVLKLALPSGTTSCTIEAAKPTAVATGIDGSVYVLDGIEGGTANPVLRKYSPACAEDTAFKFSAGVGFSTGLATSSACGITGTDFYVSNSIVDQAFIRFLGSPPDPTVCPPPKVAPTVEDQFAISADTGAATVKAEINPNFWPDTTYYVEYGTGECAAGGCPSKVPLTPASLGGQVVSDGVPTASTLLNGLTPDTTYNYRFVSQSSGGGPVFGVDPDGEGPEEATFEDGLQASLHTFPPTPPPSTGCPNQTFRTEFSASLPDCRAFEMVSPVDKNNGDIAKRAGGFALFAGAAGRATFSSYRGFANPRSAPYTSQYLAERDPSTGWQTRSLSAPRESISVYPTSGTPLFKAFSPDLCEGWMVQDNRIALAPGAPDDVANLYRRTNCGPDDDAYELLTTVAPPGFTYEPFDSTYFPQPQGSSADGTRTVYRADAALTANACTTPPSKLFQVYEAIEGEAGSDQLELVSVLPNGTAACTHSSAGTAQGLEGEFRSDNVHNAVSADGSRVFWTSTENSEPPPNGGRGDQPGRLYLRINVGEEQSALSGETCTEVAKACTLRVSQLISSAPARFWSADPEGKTAIFSIGETLYRFEVEPTPKATPIATGFLGLMGASEDAGSVYFGSKVDLGGGPNGQGSEPQVGKPNLYLFEQGAGVRFVGTLSAADVFSVGLGGFPTPSPIAPEPNLRTARVTADGEVAVFQSTVSLTGFDNTDVASGQPNLEVFRYAASTGDLVCVSCNQSGVRPAGRLIASAENGAFQLWAAAQIPGWTEQLRPTRQLSDSGDRLFFESYEALVTRDTNGVGDVYEWQRATSRAQCEGAPMGGEVFVPETSGCLSLISSGESPVDSEFLDASVNGSDVLIVTQATLLPQDPGLFDVYDARVNGGFPPPPPPPAPCEGTACQSPPPPPVDQTPSSAGYHGPGNVKQPRPKPCPKGKHKVKKNGKGKCVKNKKNRGRASQARRAAR